jgi:TolA-binding protein
MEILIIIMLSVSGIGGYFIYQSLPITKFKKASRLFSAGNLDEAENIFIEVFDKIPGAPAKLAECFFTRGLNSNKKNETEAIRFFNKVLELKKQLPGSASKDKYESIEAKAFYEIAKIKFSNAKELQNTDNKIKSIKENLRYLETVTYKEIKNNFATLREKHLAELAEIYFRRGTENEKNSDLVAAIHNYSTANDFSQDSIGLGIREKTIIRIAICKLKNREPLEAFTFESIESISVENQIFIDYKKDFYYRYSIALLKEKNFAAAERTISNYLHSEPEKTEKLISIIKNERLKNAYERINILNQKYQSLHNNNFPESETRVFYESIDKAAEELVIILPEIEEKLQGIKPSIFNKLLTKYISNEKYDLAINIILEFPKFWESSELLKNLGICSYKFAAQGNLTDEDYKIVLSSWLTAVYSDNVLLNSLENTAWDDEYTFTLIDSIGTKYSQIESLPENVNYDVINDTNISIGSTQKELLHQFETVLHKEISEHEFSKEVTDFYTNERDSLERVISIIREDILFIAPYFAKQYGLNDNIIQALDDEYSELSNEEALEAGIPYLKNYSANTYVGEYYIANECAKKITNSIYSLSLEELRYAIATYGNLSLMAKYELLYKNFEKDVISAFNSILNGNDDCIVENKILMLEECIKFIPDNINLKFRYSNFVTSYCISKYNKNEIDNFKALTLLETPYLYSNENPRICQTLVTIILYNLMDIINGATYNEVNIYKILDNIKNNLSPTFKQYSTRLSEERTKILKQLKSSGVNINPLIASVGIGLNEKGRKLFYILAYMQGLSDGRPKSNALNDPYAEIREMIIKRKRRLDY